MIISWTEKDRSKYIGEYTLETFLADSNEITGAYSKWDSSDKQGHIAFSTKSHQYTRKYTDQVLMNLDLKELNDIMAGDILDEGDVSNWYIYNEEEEDEIDTENE